MLLANANDMKKEELKNDEETKAPIEIHYDIHLQSDAKIAIKESVQLQVDAITAIN